MYHGGIDMCAHTYIHIYMHMHTHIRTYMMVNKVWSLKFQSLRLRGKRDAKYLIRKQDMMGFRVGKYQELWESVA